MVLDDDAREAPGRLRSRAEALLAAADAQDPASARQAIFRQTLGHLVPDEALIVRELARRTSSVLVHLHSWTRTGVAGEAVLENASLVGRQAGVALPALTCFYVARLRFVGMVELGPEDPALEDDYRVLLTEPSVLHAMARVSEESLTPRVLRHTLRLSTLGRELWACAFPSSPVGSP